jgi:hypothetical protein
MYGDDSGLQLLNTLTASGNVPQNIEKEFKVINLINDYRRRVTFLPKPIL